jgi:hypothetical protein
LTHSVRLSALAALDIQQAREWHDAREPGLGDHFLERVNETMTRIGQNPHHTRRSSKTFEGPIFASSNMESGTREDGRLSGRGMPAPSAAARDR